MTEIPSDEYVAKTATAKDLHESLTELPVPGWPRTYQSFLAHPAFNRALRKVAISDKYIAPAKTVAVDYTTFQPWQKSDSKFVNEDRHCVQFWPLSSGTWTFAALFDGHAGPETAQHTVEQLPILLRKAVEDATTSGIDSSTLIDSVISTIKAFDQSIADDFTSIFPNGVDELTEERVKEIINDHATGGVNYKKAILCMRGCTALITLIDPAKENMWIFNLGDCQAVLGQRGTDAELKAERITTLLNGSNPAEIERIQREHPGEEEVVLQNRVLGLIAVFRAIGDFEFKLPVQYTTKVFLHVEPGFRMVNGRKKVMDMIPRHKTPPYLSNEPEVVHKKIQPGMSIVMSTDGLMDMYEEHARTDSESIYQTWFNLIENSEAPELEELEGNKALAILKDALGKDLDRQSLMLVADRGEGPILDDTTILVLTL